MADHSLGGPWTQQKLGCVESYAKAWNALMQNEIKKWGWRTRFIDAFSGMGGYRRKDVRKSDEDKLFGPEGDEKEIFEILKGSARIAIEISPKFGRIDLIEQNDAFSAELKRIAGADLARRVFVHERDANDAITDISAGLQANDRAIAFLDPYGCELKWDSLTRLAHTKRADVWYLFPTMGINRQLRKNPKDIPDHAKRKITDVVGTDTWESVFYESDIETDLFGVVDKTTRRAGPSSVEKYFLDRLKTIFPYVHEECLRLRNSKNGHLFSLCFAVSNDSENAIKHARRLAKKAIDAAEK